jgi:phenylpyruvate tautomerase PptA (4-oxalocrotonate tautomerase family)
MPLVTITVRKPCATARKHALLDAVHGALVAVGVPPTDKFQRVFELDAADFRYDAGYPDTQAPRGDGFALVELLWSVGRSVKVKKQFLAHLVEGLRAQGIDPEQVMVVFKETQWENWSFAGGRQIHV